MYNYKAIITKTVQKEVSFKANSLEEARNIAENFESIIINNSNLILLPENGDVDVEVVSSDEYVSQFEKINLLDFFK